MTDVANWFHGLIQAMDPYLGVVLAVPVFWTWIVVMSRRRRERKLIEGIKDNPGHRPVILVVSLLRGRADIRGQVENFRQQQAELKSIPDDRVFVIGADALRGSTPELNPDHMLDFGRELDRIGAKIYMLGTDVIHYFHAGPFPTAAVVGAQLSNGPRVLLYHWDQQQGTYRNWGPLKHLHALG